MRNEQCPLCFGVLEVREVAPCEECEGDPQEIEHFRQGKHTYQRLEVFAGLELTLCNFCIVDFGSSDLVVLLGGEAELRCGEIMALEWTDIDFAKRQLSVARSE